MTNRIEMIDPAILRRGRFDHIIKVDMASEAEVRALLERLIDQLPRRGALNVDPIAKQLQGRPLSDVAFVIREAARLAARSGESKLSQENLVAALDSTGARGVEPKSRSIGFVWSDDKK
jgi:ATP-dependent 26S proteasome regulatory subunit